MKKNFPGPADLHFYNSKKTPAWAKKIQSNVISSIDDCVNAHAGITSKSNEVAYHNVMVFIKGWQRRNEDVLDHLEQIAMHPECAINPEKRAAFAKRLIRRLTSQQ